MTSIVPILHYITYSRPGLKYILRIKDKKICKNNSTMQYLLNQKQNKKKKSRYIIYRSVLNPSCASKRRPTNNLLT